MLIGLYQFALTVGIALADLVGYWLANQQAWRLMFGIAVVPTVFFLAVILTVPESPRWLFAHERPKDAESVLKSYTDPVGAERFLDDIREGLRVPMEQSWSALWSPAVRGALFVAVGLTVLQQATGTFALSHKAIMGPSLGVIAIACLMGYIACFAFSLGAIAWILVSEVFPLRVRAWGRCCNALLGHRQFRGLTHIFVFDQCSRRFQHVCDLWNIEYRNALLCSIRCARNVWS
jgi:MFS family permease